jgi:hypothetical protein|tara:strand:+ start:1366 stop:2028 length:663 start_codon:yes stop_codon:yes gene_type:complete
MDSVDKKRLIEHTHRYNKLNLRTSYTANNTTGKLKFTIPPLNSSGFAHPSKNECICKIRKVYIGTGVGSSISPIGYMTITDFLAGGGTPAFFGEGLTLNTSISSHNVVFAQSGSGDGFNGLTDTTQAKSMLGVMMPPKGYRYIIPTLGDNQFLEDMGIYDYEDFSKIEDSGTLCSNPFGKTFEIWLSGASDFVPLVPVDESGEAIDENVRIAVEIEVMTL